MTAFVYESERYVREKVQILGVSVEPAEEGRRLRERITATVKKTVRIFPSIPIRCACWSILTQN